jgi:3-dehydroquinate synthase
VSPVRFLVAPPGARRLPFFMHASTLFADDINQLLTSIIDGCSQGAYVLIDEKILQLRSDLTCLDGARSCMSMSGGESIKEIAGLEKSVEWLAAENAERGSTLLVIGGGSLLDLGGFVASIYKRGMDLVLVPTTLLAMVDAAVGGKNGINTRFAKNMLGTFYQPKQIISDEKFLKSLTQDELKSGVSEMLKHAFIAGGRHWRDFCLNMVPGKLPPLHLVSESSRIKAEITSADEREASLRMVLNFGHTLGHAIESYFLSTSISASHGACVATGMAIETILSESLGFTPSHVRTELLGMIDKHSLALSVDLPEFEKVAPYLMNDKKIQQGKFLIPCFSSSGVYEIKRIDHDLNLRRSYENYCEMK